MDVPVKPRSPAGRPSIEIDSAKSTDETGVVSARVRAVRRWSSVGERLILGLTAAEKFITLRDHHEVNEVPPGNLKVCKRLGEGAFATVDLCDQVLPGGVKQLVAVKRFKPGVITGYPSEVDAFLTECSLMRKLHHKYVVSYVGVGYEPGDEGTSNLFLVQEYLGGGTVKRQLLEQMSDRGKVVYSNQQALQWCIHVASALAYLHSSNPTVIHRDLKMDNILLTSDKQVAKLADFGLAGFIRHQFRRKNKPLLRTVATESPRQHRNVSQFLTDQFRSLSSPRKRHPLLRSQTLQVTEQMSGKTGTLMYMAPEMFKREPYNAKVDVFSFAMIMYELFHRYLTIVSVAIQGTEEEVEAYAAKVSEGHRPPIKLENFPPEFIKLIEDCWAQNPNDRPHMSQVVESLKAIANIGLPEEEPDQACCAGGCSIM